MSLTLGDVSSSRRNTRNILSQTMFLKIRKSDLRIHTSTPFEKMKKCVASYSVSGKDLDVILKFKDINDEAIRKVIKDNSIPEDYVAQPIPIHANTIKEDAINLSTTQKDLGFLFIKCKPEDLEEISDKIRKRAYQVYETTDEYNLWAIFVENKVHFYNEIFQVLYETEVRDYIEHSFVAFVLKVRKPEEPPPVDLLHEIQDMLRTTKGSKGYWSVSIDMVLTFLAGETSIPRIKQRLPQYSREYLYKSKDRLLRKGFISESRKEGRTSYYVVNKERYPILYWRLFEQ